MTKKLMRRVALAAILLATGRAVAEDEDLTASFSCTNAAGEVVTPLGAGVVSITRGENGVALDITKDDVTNVTVVVECSGLTAAAAGARVLFMTQAVSGGTNCYNREGLLLTPDGSLQGVWSGNAWGDAAGAAPLDGARMHLVLHYDTQRGVSAYAVRDGAAQLLYWHDGLRSSFETIRGVTVGGGFGDVFAPCAGLVVHALVVYEADLAGCALESVTIGSGVTSLGQWGGSESGWAFLECWKLKAVHIGDLSAWCAMDIYDETSNPLYYAHNLYLNGELVTDLVIPDGVTRIPARAFCGATCLRSVTLPDTVTSIGEEAFGGCLGLESVTIPDSVTNVNAQTFADSSRLWARIYSATAADSTPIVVDAPASVALTVTNVVVHYVTAAAPSEAVTVPTDTGLVSVIGEVVAGTTFAIPSDWSAQYERFEEKFGTDFAAAVTKPTGKRDGSGNLMQVWQDYVAGTDPTDPDDVFTASIAFDESGAPVITYSPQFADPAEAAKRKYTTYGKVKLTDADWVEVPNGREGDFNFFKVTVEMR